MDGKKRRILFIVNPKSGKGLIKNHLLEIIDVFVKDRMDVEVYVTQRKMDACRVTRRRAQNYDIIVCSGGDGTLDEVVTGMMELPRQQRAPGTSGEYEKCSNMYYAEAAVSVRCRRI